MRRTMVAGNWKMHGTRASVAELIDGLRNLDLPSDVEIAVFPSDLFIDRVINGLEDTPISVGAQDAAIDSKQGALTGEISPSQLVDAGCELVLIGHSERRLILGESDETLNRKFAAAQASGLTPVLCIGETLEQREAGQTLEVVERQLNAVINEFGIDVFASAVIAYEPVWAIGTGLTATPQQAQDVHAAIRAQLAQKNPEVAQSVRLLYGGSVKAANAVELFSMPDIDGGLIGGASLNADEFGAICRAAGN
ncbi:MULTISPECIES: triose-phosphate isomerase [unclassified Pseudomonas]|uniref:triose-phosphate isomerase n=1 Tax=unclassified Pseudomonas TaxID=196821 RepID=UPI0012964368|nr:MULTISPECIES: triose-phosphate isomerase [unclassified Pseudomonas]MQT40258.1 triose-phosphate isomerase [Pseudomonas sp. FSL R10-0765]MQT51484.1 triose-phosphate isomerase [Pseudomonas sp. FSL R10-2398]MQU01461.1 triose-phosphate isomerase [Pseudomonas sp. FSL R10-2245]MQU11332.1 triose-phosphate isomerase [Pseudomonas sp. FSL R10-2189]MQU36369.1 triose-phosphate isomerase [Pseudomonas sp. FSL R10-2172]